jgi:hypothetical protein
LQTSNDRLLISCLKPLADVLFLHRNQQTIGKQYKGNRNQGLPTETQKCNSARQKTTIKPVLRSVRINLRLKKILQGGLRNSLTAVPSQSRGGFFYFQPFSRIFAAPSEEYEKVVFYNAFPPVFLGFSRRSFSSMLYLY